MIRRDSNRHTLRQSYPAASSCLRCFRHHLVGQRQAVRRHDQDDNNLNAIRSFVPAIAKAPFAHFGRIAFKMCAGQIVEQNLEIRPEQTLLSLLQEAEQLRIVHHQLSRHRYRLSLCARAKSAPSTSPIALRTIAGAAATRCQPRSGDRRPASSARPASVSPAATRADAASRNHPAAVDQHMAGQPAGTPLPRGAAADRRAGHPPHRSSAPVPHDPPETARSVWLAGRLRQTRQLSGTTGIIDLTKIRHMPLHRPTAGHPTDFHDAPVAVLFPVLPADILAQQHDRRLPKPGAVFARRLVGTASDFRRFLTDTGFSVTLPTPRRRKISEVAVELRKLG